MSDETDARVELVDVLEISLIDSRSNLCFCC